MLIVGEKVTPRSKDALVKALLEAILRAEGLHPLVARSKHELMTALTSEVGEVATAILKKEGQKRLYDELMDTCVVAFRGMMWFTGHEKADEG